MGGFVSGRAILHVISGLGIGGAEASLVQIATALQARGMPQHVVCVGAIEDYTAELRSRGVGVTVLGIDGVTHLPAGIIRIARLVRQADPTVVQGWMYHGNLLAALAHRLSGRRRRLYWNLRASNVDAARYGRVVRLGAWLSRSPDVVIANSRAGVKFHVDQGFKPRRIEVIGNGIDTQKFQPDMAARAAVRAELGIAEEAIVAIHAARVDPMKDHATLLAALSAVPNITGLLVGAGTERLSVPQKIRALGLRYDLPRLYAAADIVVSSSAFGEGFSNVIGEGMSVGLVPITTDVGDAHEITGDSGYVVAPGDVAALADALAAAARWPAAERHARGLRARARIAELYPVTKMVDQYAHLYAAGT
jgi:glycosyltransferase involved in cell wall biosynthesis